MACGFFFSNKLQKLNIELKCYYAIVKRMNLFRFKPLDETREGVERQRETDSLLSEALSEQDENDVLMELDALVPEKEGEKFKLPEVPQDELSLPSADETSKESKAAIIEKPKKILIEA